MSEVTNVAAPQMRVKVGSTSTVSSSADARGQKTGNSLPSAVKAATSEAASLSDQQVTQESVKAAVAKMNDYIQSTQRDLTFSYDAEAGETVVKVLDRKTQEVIRQIPDQAFLDIARSLDQNNHLNLFSAQV